ncbi:MAG: response regulator transcription factor [Chloroflexi bacterium]|nr:response regulator transcription factor [Chloroflexota bacterium]
MIGITGIRSVARGVGWFSRPETEKVVRRMQEGRAEMALSEREMDVLRLLAKGWTNCSIAKEMTVSERTLGFHVGNVLGKLAADSRTEAMVIAIKKGWLKL